jgi:uncharacterized protein (DUF1684 family)
MRRRPLVAAALILLATGCARLEPDQRAWVASLQADRTHKDAFLRGPDGPLLPEQRPGFAGLSYYRPDFGWVVEAAWEPPAAPDTVRFLTSANSADVYLRHGRLRFERHGQAYALTVFRSLDGHLFLPFLDATTGRETYGAGRYLDPEPLPGNRFRLDFNRAYNPYCAYNARWVCPLAPAENRRPVPVEAGEKNFHE